MVTFRDVHSRVLPRPMDAVEFTTMVLTCEPVWLKTLLTLRDRIVGPFGFTTQSDATELRLVSGAAAGPFLIEKVSPARVVCANKDRHIGFTTIFLTQDVEGQPRGFLCTQAWSTTWLGTVYLACIWPFHRLLMGSILRSAKTS